MCWHATPPLALSMRVVDSDTDDIPSVSMTNDLSVKNTVKSLAVPSIGDVLKAFLDGKATTTIAEYKRDIYDFCDYLTDQGIPTRNGEEVAKRFVENGPGQTQLDVLGYRNELLRQRKAPATVNRRISSMKAFTKALRLMGLTSWGIEIVLVQSKPLKDTRGPGVGGVSALLQQIAKDDRGDEYKNRDALIVWCLFGLGLRRNELLAVDIKDIDLERKTIAITGKGRREKEHVTMSTQVLEAVKKHLLGPLEHAPDNPLIYALSQGYFGKRLTGMALTKILAKLAHDAGIPHVTPHGLRHAAVTAALDSSGGNIRAAQRFARHRDVKTTMIYDDNREDLAGKTASAIGDLLTTKQGENKDE